MELDETITSNEKPSSMDVKINEVTENSEKPNFVNSIGASWLGNHCSRYVWMKYRNVVTVPFKAETLRKFEIGNIMEDYMAKKLSSIVIIKNTGDSQLKIKADCVTCMPDGIIESIPESNNPHVWENKTMNNADFKRLQKEGLQKAFPSYYVQNQIEMEVTKTPRSLYTVENTETGEIYTFRTKADGVTAKKYIDRANEIALMEDIPEKISANPDFYLCKMCPYDTFCHVTNHCIEVNCRTCAFVTPNHNNDFKCSIYDNDSVPLKAQKEGCECHAFIPTILPFKFCKEACQPGLIAYDHNGQIIYNGYKGVHSKDLASAMTTGEVDQEEIKF